MPNPAAEQCWEAPRWTPGGVKLLHRRSRRHRLYGIVFGKLNYERNIFAWAKCGVILHKRFVRTYRRPASYFVKFWESEIVNGLDVIQRNIEFAK